MQDWRPKDWGQKGISKTYEISLQRADTQTIFTDTPSL